MIDRKLRVFLCHASQDKAIVRELYERLNAEGWIDPWLDEEKLLPGQDWDMEIEKAVEAADAVIVCLSNNSVSKEGYVQKELRKVLDVADQKPEGKVFIIPLRLEDCLPPRRLQLWQYADYFPEHNRKKTLERVFESLKLRAVAIGLRFVTYSEKEQVDNQKKMSTDNLGVDLLVLRYWSYLRSKKIEVAIEKFRELGYKLVVRPKNKSNYWDYDGNAIFYGNPACLDVIEKIRDQLGGILRFDRMLLKELSPMDAHYGKKTIVIQIVDESLFVETVI